jgi:DNA repair protein RecO (recombination protein O)
MKFGDEGIIIDVKKYGESSLIIKVFTQQNGIYRGFIKSAKSSKQRSLYQIGNLISFEFIARLEESLGSFISVDLIESFCGKIIFEKLKLDCAASLFSMFDNLFLEREEQQNLFMQLKNFLSNLCKNDIEKNQIIGDYIKLELAILQALGYGLDLSCCAVTNSEIDLKFVSPKSGRAVSLHAGIPYQNRLLKLPNFLIEDSANPQSACLLEGLKLSGFFLEKFLQQENHKSKFLLRGKIIDNLSL